MCFSVAARFGGFIKTLITVVISYIEKGKKSASIVSVVCLSCNRTYVTTFSKWEEGIGQTEINEP